MINNSILDSNGRVWAQLEDSPQDLVVEGGDGVQVCWTDWQGREA